MIETVQSTHWDVKSELPTATYGWSDSW